MTGCGPRVRGDIRFPIAWSATWTFDQRAYFVATSESTGDCSPGDAFSSEPQTCGDLQSELDRLDWQAAPTLWPAGSRHVLWTEETVTEVPLERVVFGGASYFRCLGGADQTQENINQPVTAVKSVPTRPPLRPRASGISSGR